MRSSGFGRHCIYVQSVGLLVGICGELELYLWSVGSDGNVGHELPLYLMKTIADSMTGNCLILQTVITQKVVGIAFGHSNILFIASKFICI